MEGNKVYITNTSSFFPNEPIGNDEIETYLGKIGDKPSRVKPIILRQNGIKQRYYAIDENQNITHTNTDLAKEAIFKLLPEPSEREKIQYLACGTSTPDQMLPSQASMIHGTAFKHPMEIVSFSGVCLTGLQALKSAFMSIKSGNTTNAVSTTSELPSPVLQSKFFEEEFTSISEITTKPYIAFEKDFLRFMISDGAAALLLKNEPTGKLNLEIEWIEIISFANRLPACMYQWSEKMPNEELKSWKEFSTEDISKKSVWCIKQDVKLLNKNIMQLFAEATQIALSKHKADEATIRYVIPHISSMYFYNILDEELKKKNVNLPTSKWYTNLTWVGNVGSVAPFAALDELIRTKPLAKGDQILLLVPESGRFSFGVALLTCV
ncbi:MAG: StlD/DarB family beta-ketosynthase [Muribaculaceae bacterium]|nr:StlD/DarB family beta-ketosynthase [Muribaculaceae bacterium]